MASDDLLTPQYASAASGGAEEAAETAKEQVQAQAGQLAARAAGQVRGQIDSRSTQAAEQIIPFADALHGAGEHLEREGYDAPGRAARRLAGQIEHLSGYLQIGRASCRERV